jgi:hypothetical protein
MSSLTADISTIKADSTVYKADDNSVRYLVMGLTGNSADTSVWSYTSGGATGAPVPTLDDQVICDANSLTGASGNLTISANFACGGWIDTGLTKVLTKTSTAYTFSCYGSMTLHATNSRWAFTSLAYMYQKGTGTITTNGNTFLVWNRWFIDGVGITVTNADAMNLGETAIFHANGTWNTNGKAITVNNSYRTAAGTKTLTLGSSIFTALGWNNVVISGTTINYDTSTVIIYRAGVNGYIEGNNGTFYNLTITGITSITAKCDIYSGCTVNNLLTITGANATSQRILVQSNTIGTPRTITIATGAPTPVLTNVDFQDIHLHNTDADPLNLSARTDIGDCGGNTGITFPAGTTQTWNGTTGSVSNAAKWTSRVPLPQDSAVVGAGWTGTITMDCPRIGSLDMSACSQAVTWALGNAINCYGHFILGNNITTSGDFAVFLCGRIGYDLKTYNKSIYHIGVNAYGGIYTLKSDLTNRLVSRIVDIGTIDFNDFNVTLPALSQNPGTVIYFGNGLIELTCLNAAAFISLPGTIYAEGSTIKINPAVSSNTFTVITANTYNVLWFSGSHTGNFDINSSNTFAQLIIDPGRKVRVGNGTTQTITPTGQLTEVGNPSSRITLTTISGTASIAYAGTGYQQMDYTDFSNLTFTAAKFFAGRNSTQSNCVNLNAGIVQFLTGALSGSGTLTGQMTAYRALSGALLGEGTLTGSMIRELLLSGDLLGEGTLTGNMVAYRAMSGDLLGEGTLTGTMIRELLLSGDLLGEGSLTGQMTAYRAMSGNLLGEGTLAGDAEILLPEFPFITDPSGIDALVQRLRLQFIAKLFSGKNYLSTGIAYENRKNGGNIPEGYINGNEYREILVDDNRDVISFFTVDPNMQVRMSEARAKVNIYFLVNLNSLFPHSHRAVEEVIILALHEIYNSPFQVERLVTGTKSLNAFDIRRPELMNMQPYFCFRFDTTINYKC